MSRFVKHNLTSMGIYVCLQGRENKRGGLQQLETTPGRQLRMKAGFGKRSEKETSRWASVHDALHLVEATTNVEMAFVSKNSLAFRDAHASNEAQTMPFKAIQSSPLMDHKLLGLEESKKKTGSGIVMSGAATGRLASAQQQQPAAGNVVNAAGTGSHVRPGTDAEAYDCDSPSSFDFSKAGVYQVAVGSVPKLHTPSKWDDAEKWLSASDQTPAGSGSKAAGSKSRSGPLQAHVVANEGGVKMSKKALFSNPGAAAAGRPQSGTKNGTASNAVVHQGGLLDASFSSASSVDNSGEGRDDQSTSEQYSGPKKVVDLSNAAKYRTSVEGSEALTRGRGGGGHQQARLELMRASAGTPNMSSAVIAVDRYPLNDLHGHDHMSDGIVEGSSTLSPDHHVTDHDNYLKTALRTAKPISESRTGAQVKSCSFPHILSCISECQSDP
jgi:co-chaperonin GroES (HSP10)